jgi:hypothetical protein
MNFTCDTGINVRVLKHGEFDIALHDCYRYVSTCDSPSRIAYLQVTGFVVVAKCIDNAKTGTERSESEDWVGSGPDVQPCGLGSQPVFNPRCAGGGNDKGYKCMNRRRGGARSGNCRLRLIAD